MFIRALLVVSSLIWVASFPELSIAEQEYTRARYTVYVGDHKKVGLDRNFDFESELPRLMNEFDSIHDQLSRIFDFNPTRKIIFRFMDKSEFHKSTGAPNWTSALFLDGKITVPIPEYRNRLPALTDAVRHEYVHAFVAEMSKDECPSWVDEGIAQLLEGEPNPLLGPALRSWLIKNPPIPLQSLEIGFTSLDEKIVPSAYALSLFATRSLVNTYGMESLVRFIQKIGEYHDTETAFRVVYNRSINDFSELLSDQLAIWSKSNIEHP